ncbi:streptophobe family protein [Streptomyces sp. NPDC002523]
MRLGVATALALPFLVWLTDVSVDASLSVLGFDAFGAGIGLHGRLGAALLLGAVWGAAAGAAGALVARATGAARSRVVGPGRGAVVGAATRKVREGRRGTTRGVGSASTAAGAGRTRGAGRTGRRIPTRTPTSRCETSGRRTSRCRRICARCGSRRTRVAVGRGRRGGRRVRRPDHRPPAGRPRALAPRPSRRTPPWPLTESVEGVATTAATTTPTTASAGKAARAVNPGR